MKRILSIILAIALAISMFPASPGKVEAAGPNNFTFFGEQYDVASARITTDSRVNLTGTINNVLGNTIKYGVYQISMEGGTEKVLSKNENQTSNMTLNGSSISVQNIALYPGLNRITFVGTSGSSEVSDSIYIEFRNGPTLYNLTASLHGTQFPIDDTKTTVVHSSMSRGLSNVDISISGNAPNADKVTVIVNNRSYTYTVSSTTNYSFVASPVNVHSGKNTVTIRVFNKSQVVETTRDVAFYNGEVTFYDLQLATGAGATLQTAPLEGNPNFSVTASDTIRLEGKVIIPLLYDTSVSPAVFKPDPTALQPSAMLKYNLNAAGFTDIATVNLTSTGITPSTSFIEATITQDLGVANTTLTFDTLHSLELQGQNYVRTPAGADTSDTYGFTLRNKNLAYIYQINYLQGYTSSTTAAQLPTLSGSDLQGSNVFSLPMGVEILVGNPSFVVPHPADLVQLIQVQDSSGTYTTKGTGFDYRDITPPADLYVTRTVDGVSQQFLRIFMEINKLPNASQEKLTFKLNGSNTATNIVDKTITLLYGPFVKFDTVYDGMKVEYDTTDPNAITYLLDTIFDKFNGELFNVNNPADIRYSTSGSGLQSVFLYINNVEIPLEVEAAATPNRFKMVESAALRTAAFNALYQAGDNTLKFVFRTTKNTYEKSMKVTLVPTNLPVIPAPGTDGVFPYSSNLAVPLPNDPKFPLKGSVYTTTEAKMNVYGTFDFIDLGQNSTSVGTKLGLAGLNKANYKLKITSPGMADIEWTLNNDLVSNTNDALVTGAAVSGIKVIYNYDSQTFAFLLTNQTIPSDGSSRVYNITVLNSGDNGPSARYRLEVDPTSIPYTILAPITEKRIANKDYVDVIITSPGADSITVNGGKSKNVTARKVSYRDYGHLVAGLPSLVPAFSATVTGLAPNKANRIDFVIKRGTDTIKDSITITYAPENIPGASVMQKMTSSHKAFDNKLNLTFPKGAHLIRKDYNVPDNLKGQVYDGNDIMFSIANPEDGVIDRHDFETVPANYDLEVNMGKVLFVSSFSQRFIKASPVYWIDPGQADNPFTPSSYDPIMGGSDPYPFSVIEGDTPKYFYSRDSNRELIPSKAGTLTLNFDPNVRQGAGTLITIYRFDPFALQWENIGGVVDDKKNTIKVPFTRFGYYVVAKMAYGFNDISEHPYARESLEAIYSKGVMNAFDPSGLFGADKFVTRGEFARMLVRALDLPLNFDGANHFVDVPNTGNFINMDALWDYRYIETAARAGYVRGTQPRVFEPDRELFRQEAAVMLAKALNLKLSVNLESTRKTLQKSFKDEQNIDFYAKPSVEAVVKKGFMSGSPVDINDPKKGYVFEPTSRMLRGDAAIVMAKVMADLKKLPKLYGK